MNRILSAAIAALLTFAAIAPATATSGPGCLRVVNVSANDALNLRSGPSSSNRIVDSLVPDRHGVISLNGPCVPKNRPWGQRWCPVTHFSGDETTSGWVKARFVRDSECP